MAKRARKSPARKLRQPSSKSTRKSTARKPSAAALALKAAQTSVKAANLLVGGSAAAAPAFDSSVITKAAQTIARALETFASVPRPSGEPVFVGAPGVEHAPELLVPLETADGPITHVRYSAIEVVSSPQPRTTGDLKDGRGSHILYVTTGNGKAIVIDNVANRKALGLTGEPAKPKIAPPPTESDDEE